MELHAHWTYVGISQHIASKNWIPLGLQPVYPGWVYSLMGRRGNQVEFDIWGIIITRKCQQFKWFAHIPVPAQGSSFPAVSRTWLLCQVICHKFTWKTALLRVECVENKNIQLNSRSVNKTKANCYAQRSRALTVKRSVRRGLSIHR